MVLKVLRHNSACKTEGKTCYSEEQEIILLGFFTPNLITSSAFEHAKNKKSDILNWHNF